MIVDAHVHLVSADGARYPRRPGGDGTWWERAYEVDDLERDLRAGEVAGAVVVQAVSPYGHDCRMAADAVAGQERLALVASVDMAAPDPVASFERLRATTALAGLRLFGVADGAQWLIDGSAEAVWEAAAGTGCVLVPTLFPDALPALRRVVEAHPAVPVALDHCAFPDFGGLDAIDRLCALADLPAVHLKVTSHNLDSHAPAAPGDPSGFVDTLIAAFGASRVCWGSDHPQHQGRTYTEKVDLAHRAARNLTPTDRALFLGGTAARLWPTPATTTST
ncbi:MAG: amidohydrolase family protein [Acidimicrobiales bacterium]